MNIKELYAMPSQYIEKDLSVLKGLYYNHILEATEALDNLGFYFLEHLNNEDVEIRIIKEVEYDSRRFWRLATVWYKDLPVMVIQNAGREGDDHAERFITSKENYHNMIRYIISLFNFEHMEIDTHDTETEIENLTSFYGDSL